MIKGTGSGMTRRVALAGTAATAAGLLVGAGNAAKPPVLIVVGPSKHPPGTHEVAAGGRLLQHCLEAAGLAATVISAWPDDAAKRHAGVASVVFIGDMFPPEVMPNRDVIMKDLTAMMARGCGLVCVHYATGLEARHVTPEGDHPLLHWMGGYFATRCKHHQSIARVFREATIEPSSVNHPVLRGWKSFTCYDEPYINNYLGPNGPAKNVTILATSQLPPEKPNTEPVAWAIERPDTGRGVGVVMPHFYKNWQLPDLRTLILNAIVWTAKQEIPAAGVQVKLPDLASFKPAAVEVPSQRKK